MTLADLAIESQAVSKASLDGGTDGFLEEASFPFKMA